MGWDKKTRKKNSMVDFAYLVGIWSPNAGPESLRMMLDWDNWIFLFDDRLSFIWILLPPLTFSTLTTGQNLTRAASRKTFLRHRPK